MSDELDWSAQPTKAKNLLVRIWNAHPAARPMIEAGTGNWFVWGTDRDAPASLPDDPKTAAQSVPSYIAAWRPTSEVILRRVDSGWPDFMAPQRLFGPNDVLYSAPPAPAQPAEDARDATFAIGDAVRKRSGSQWSGTVVGTYSTKLTPEGYAIESLVHSGSVQIYPASALELVAPPVDAAIAASKPKGDA